MDRPPLGDVQDLSTLARLDESILLDEINERYRRDKIYTYVGDILIAVNPFKDLDIYGKEFSARYQNIKQSAFPPHIFAVADSAYQALTGRGGRPPGNQCILISGESGAGKTESTKLIIKQLVELCRGNTQLEQQILQVNPLLEAFGNAQTNLNDNSSRFGKYIQLKFLNGHVVGAKISEYLLEKSRVIHQNPGEETFHIFYYVFAAHKDGKFGLGDPESYRYITNGAKDFPKKLSALYERYEDLVNAMDLVGFTDEEQLDMFAIIASVLHLGNVSFKVNENDDSVSVTDSNGPIKTAAKFLGIDTEEVEACLTCMVNVTKGEYVKRNYNQNQAQDARDAMAKAVYGRLFGWIVNKINCLLVPDFGDATLTPHLDEIGILDIFGFEDFAKEGGKNSFEQACINLANEQLQFFFNQHIFKMEQEEYQREGVDWKEITFMENKPLLDMFLTKPIGIFALLDEESLFPKGTDQSFVHKLVKTFSGNQYFSKSQQTNTALFSINHYAGKVQYSAEKWLEKNRDTLPPGITQVLQSSNNVLIKTIFRGQITRTGSLALQGRKSTAKRSKLKTSGALLIGDAAKRKMTVGGQFKNSLAILMERMTSSSPIFVRCLKPNHYKLPGQLDTKYLLNQLLYTGMLETIEIRRKGFAVRPSFADFVEKYKILVDLKLTGTAENCLRILQASKTTGWYIGKTKVFLKYCHTEQLTDLLDQMGKSAVQIQRVIRGFLARRKFKKRLEEARRERDAVAALLTHALTVSMKASEQLNAVLDHDRNRPKSANLVVPAQLPAVPTFPADAISVASSYSYLEPVKKVMASTGTQIEDEGDESDEVLEDDFKPVASNLSKFGRSGTKHAAVNWFKETQTYNVMNQTQTRFADWFHGIISRKESEQLLKDTIIGCFLIRVSESRFGYTLSFKAETRCRHYMIDQLKNGKFVIIGEAKVHRSLHDLVAYHKKVKLSNWDHLLTVPCGQIQGECDYEDLVKDDVYFVLDPTYQDSLYQGPPIPARNYSIQSTKQATLPIRAPPARPPTDPPSLAMSASNPPPNLKSRNEGRPLPKIPQEAYEKLISEQDLHKYTQLEDGRKKKGKRPSPSITKL